MMLPDSNLNEQDVTILVFVIGSEFLNDPDERAIPLFRALILSREVVEASLEKLKELKYITEHEEKVFLHPRFKHWLVEKISNQPN